MFCIVEHLIGFHGFEKFKLQRLPLLEKEEIWLKIIAREEEVTLRTMLMDHATFFILHLWNSIYQSDHSTLCSFFKLA